VRTRLVLTLSFILSFFFFFFFKKKIIIIIKGEELVNYYTIDNKELEKLLFLDRQ
jgi:hypothetical protein